MRQLTLDMQPEGAQVAIPSPAEQRVAVPVKRDRPEVSALVLALIADGSLDFLDRTALLPGQKELRVAKKQQPGKPAWLRRK